MLYMNQLTITMQKFKNHLLINITLFISYLMNQAVYSVHTSLRFQKLTFNRTIITKTIRWTDDVVRDELCIPVVYKVSAIAVTVNILNARLIPEHINLFQLNHEDTAHLINYLREPRLFKNLANIHNKVIFPLYVAPYAMTVLLNLIEPESFKNANFSLFYFRRVR